MSSLFNQSTHRLPYSMLIAWKIVSHWLKQCLHAMTDLKESTHLLLERSMAEHLDFWKQFERFCWFSKDKFTASLQGWLQRIPGRGSTKSDVRRRSVQGPAHRLHQCVEEQHNDVGSKGQHHCCPAFGRTRGLQAMPQGNEHRRSGHGSVDMQGTHCSDHSPFISHK